MNYENILKKMTLEQKCVILSGADVFKTYAFESAGNSGNMAF